MAKLLDEFQKYWCALFDDDNVVVNAALCYFLKDCMSS